MAQDWDSDAPLEVRVHEKSDGLMVLYGPEIIGWMNLAQGIWYRMTGRLPKQMREKIKQRKEHYGQTDQRTPCPTRRALAKQDTLH